MLSSFNATPGPAASAGNPNVMGGDVHASAVARLVHLELEAVRRRIPHYRAAPGCHDSTRPP